MYRVYLHSVNTLGHVYVRCIAEYLCLFKGTDHADGDCLSDQDLLALYESTVESTDKKRSSHKDSPTCIQFTEHQACWDLNHRGAVGETALHICVLFSNTDESFREISKLLLNVYPKLSLDYYEGDEYHGNNDLLLIKRRCYY